MASRKRNDLLAAAGQQGAATDDQRGGAIPHKSCKRAVYIGRRAGLNHDKLQPEFPGGLLHGGHLRNGVGKILIDKKPNDRRTRNQLMKERKLFRPKVDAKKTCTRYVAFRPAEAWHNAGPDRVAAIDEHDWNRPGPGLG